MRAVSSGTGGTGCCRRSDMDDLQTRKPSNAMALRKAADFANGVLPIGDQSGDGCLARDGAEAGQTGAPLSRGGVPGSVENVPHHRNGDAIANDREHQDIDVVPAEFPTRAVEGQKPRPRSKACDPDDHTGELASV